MSAYTETPARREARCKARGLVLGATPEQLDDWRDRGESREHCVDRLLNLMGKCPFVVLRLIGA